MNIMQVRDTQGNLTWVEVTSNDKAKTKESVATSKLPTDEQMFESRPSFTSLLIAALS